MNEILEILYELVPEFLNHEFIKINQAQACECYIEKAMSFDSFSAVLLCDFAEKFQCLQQNEPQAAHYGQTPVSIFTAAIYHRAITPVVLASDFEKHTKDCIVAYMDKIFELMPESVEEIDIFTDNATSQFKNQYMMAAMMALASKWKKKISWHFFAPMHGKSICDGLGATVKKFVRSRILANEFLLVKNAGDFVRASEGINMKVIHMKKSDILFKNKEIHLAKIVRESKKILEIKKNHCFEISEDKNKIPKIIGHKISPKKKLILNFVIY